MKNYLKELFVIILGNVILAMAVGLFLIPSSILTGGLAGIAVLVEPFIPVSEGTVVFVLSGSLLLLGWALLGNKFMLNTCLSSILYPLLLVLVEKYMEPVSVNPVLASIYGGLLGGIGIGLVVKMGASTGGMDIPPLILNKYMGIEVSKAVMFFDAITVLLGLYFYGLEAVLVGLLSVYTTGIAIDKVITFGGAKSKSVQIISKEYQKIMNDIHNELNRGATIIDSVGGYTNETKKLLLVVVSAKEYNKLLNIINKYDGDAFVIVQDATDVHGLGFEELTRI